MQELQDKLSKQQMVVDEYQAQMETLVSTIRASDSEKGNLERNNLMLRDEIREKIKQMGVLSREKEEVKKLEEEAAAKVAEAQREIQRLKDLLSNKEREENYKSGESMRYVHREFLRG